MPNKSLAVSVDITIYSVTCPGVFLKDRDDIFLEVCVFGMHKQSHPVPAVFPLYFNERFKFHKVFYNSVSPLDLHEALSSETVTLEVVQKSRFIHAGVVLASIELTSKDFLFPYPSAVPVYSGADRELLLNKTLHFNGISPKIEFASHTSVNEVHTTASDELSDKISQINRESEGSKRNGGDGSSQEKSESGPAQQPVAGEGASQSQSGSGAYQVSISSSVVIGDGSQPGPQEQESVPVIAAAKTPSRNPHLKNQNNNKKPNKQPVNATKTTNVSTNKTSATALNRVNDKNNKNGAPKKPVPVSKPVKGSISSKPPPGRSSSAVRGRPVPSVKKRASLGVQTDRSDVRSGPCALCEAAQTARSEATYIKESSDDDRRKMKETERAHRISLLEPSNFGVPPIALGSIAGSTSSRSNCEDVALVYSEERNRFFNSSLTPRNETKSSRREKDQQNIQRPRRVQNLSLIQCFNEAYWAKQRCLLTPDFEVRRVDESWETTSVSSIKVLENQDIPPLINLSPQPVTKEANSSVTEVEKEQILVAVPQEVPTETSVKLAEESEKVEAFGDVVSAGNGGNESTLTNYDPDSFLSLSPNAFFPKTSSSPKPEPATRAPEQPEKQKTSEIELQAPTRIRSDNGGGDRPILRSSPRRAPSSCGTKKKLQKLVQKQNLLGDKKHMPLTNSNLNMVAKNLAGTKEKLKGKSLTVKVCRSTEKNPKFVVTDCGLVEHKVPPMLRFQSKNNNSKYKVVKHLPRSASPTRALNRSKSLSSFKGTALMEKPPFVVRKVDHNILKTAEPMAATMPPPLPPGGRKSRSKKRRSGAKARSKSAAGSRKTYLVEKHYDDEASDDNEEPQKFEQDGFEKYNLDAEEESEEEADADLLKKSSSKAYSSAPIRKSYDDVRTERYLRSPSPVAAAAVEDEFYVSEFSDLILDRLERKRLLEELERDARLSRLHGPYRSSSEVYAQKYEQELYWARKRRELERSLDRLYDRLYRLY